MRRRCRDPDARRVEDPVGCHPHPSKPIRDAVTPRPVPAFVSGDCRPQPWDTFRCQRSPPSALHRPRARCLALRSGEPRASPICSQVAPFARGASIGWRSALSRSFPAWATSDSASRSLTRAEAGPEPSGSVLPSCCAAVQPRCRCRTGAFVDKLREPSAIIEGSYRRQPYRSSESAGWCHVTGSGSITDGGHCTR